MPRFGDNARTMNPLLQKIGSVAHRVRVGLYRRQPEWLSHRHNKQAPETDWDAVQAGIAMECRQRGVPFEAFDIDRKDFGAFSKQFRLPLFSLYARGCREKKILEHYIAFRMLRLKPGERYMDIASENSPFPELARKHLRVEAYSQDLTYPLGFHGNRIGSSADRLPVGDNWLDGASLQCAFEHFQGDIDTNFIRELARVLKPGGRCVIVPLYMGQRPLNIYDPILYADWDDSNADPETEIVAELSLGGYFERLYSPPSLKRILIPDIGLRYRLYHVTGKETLFPSITPGAREQVSRVRYALFIEKPADPDPAKPRATASR